MSLSTDVLVQSVGAEHRKAIGALARESEFTKWYHNRSLQIAWPKLAAKGYISGAFIPGTGLVGFCVIEPKPRLGYTRLSWLGVSSEYQHQGIGRSLLDWAKRSAPHNEIRLQCAELNIGGMAFYMHAGFRYIGEKLEGGYRFRILAWLR